MKYVSHALSVAIITSASAFTTVSSHACLNTIGKWPREPLKNMADTLEAQEKKFEYEKAKNALTLKTATNFGVSLIRKGQYKKAIKVLHEAEKRIPNVATTAANLGTAYELDSDNEKALYWIKKGVERDNHEHAGTEWLHVKILEAKIALEKDKDWLTEHNVIGLPIHAFNKEAIDRYKEEDNMFSRQAFGTPFYVTDFLNNDHELIDILRAIQYQLDERVQFVKPTDPVVADLYHTMALIQHGLSPKIPALAAHQYAPPNSVVAKRIAQDFPEHLHRQKEDNEKMEPLHFANLSEQTAQKSSGTEHGKWIALFIFLLLPVAFLLYRLGNKKYQDNEL